MSKVSWFHRFRGVKGFTVSQSQTFHGFIGFVVSMVSWFQRFLGVNGFVGFVVSGFVLSMVS